jgi:hypothetical protein
MNSSAHFGSVKKPLKDSKQGNFFTGKDNFVYMSKLCDELNYFYTRTIESFSTLTVTKTQEIELSNLLEIFRNTTERLKQIYQR